MNSKFENLSNLPLKQLELIYRSIFEATPDGILILNGSTGKIEISNPYIEELLGYKKEELLGKEVWQISPIKNIVANKAEFRKLQREKIVRYEDLPLETKKGKAVEVEFINSFYRVNGVQTIQCRIREISARIIKEKAVSLENFQKDMERLSLINSILASTADGILVIDREGKVATYNKRFLELWHIPKKLVDKKDDKILLDFVMDQLSDPKEFMDKVKHLYNHPSETSYDDVYFRDDRIFERYSVPQILDKKNIGRVWSFRDVTERKKAEIKLKENEEKYRNILEASMDGFWIVNPKNGSFLEINDAACKMLGYTKNELLAMKIADVELLEKQQDVERHLRYMKKHGGDRFETKHKRKDGKIIDVEISTKYLSLTSGDINFVFARDITEKKNILLALQESEDKYRTLIESAKDLIYLIDKNGVIISLNTSAADFLHQKAQKIIGKTVFEVFPEEIAKGYYKNILKVIKTQRPVSQITVSEGAGKKAYLDASVSPVTLQGKAEYIIGISKDVTKQKEAEEAILKSNEELKKIDTLRSIILRDVTHELKTPSAIIKMTSAVLLDEYKKHDIDKVKILDYLEILSRNAVRFNDQVDSMIKLSRFENLKHIRKERTNLHDIFYKVCKEYLSYAKEKNIRFECLIDKAIYVNINQELFYRAIKHLIDNAVKYTKKGSINIKATKDKTYSLISVTDTGIGIKKEYITKIFKPFTKVDPSTEGLGLGLSTTKKIVELHRGSIAVISVYGKGTKFTITLPNK